MNRQKAAFTLTELILVVIFLGIFAVISIPKLNFAVVSKQIADCHAKKIATDLRRTRSLAISNAAENTTGFALNMIGAVPYFVYEIVNIDTAATIDSHIIDSDVSCAGGNQFEFGPLGNLLSSSDTELTVSAEGKTFTITIISATGMVKCTEN